MQGTIAQTLGLAMHGNAFLRGLEIGDFWPDATFFRYCRQVEFLAVDSRASERREIRAAADPVAWLRSFEDGCRGLRVHFVSRDEPGLGDMMTVGFAGGGSRWLIEEVGGARPFIWSDEWSVGDPDAEDGRIWSVTYRGIPAAAVACPADSPSLDRVERDLAETLEAIAGFAERIGSDHAGSFRRALACLGADPPCEPTYYRDVAPVGLLSCHAQRILGACHTGWVFGGMGSWSDGAYGEADAPEGDRLSEALFDALQLALAAVANSTLRPPDRPLSPSPTAPSGR
jgi:hypothetical protein